MADSNNTGRTLKLTKAKIKEVCGHIENGSPIKTACILSGLSESVYYHWRKTGLIDEKKRIENNKKKKTKEIEKSIYLQFLESARLAEESYVQRNIDLVNIAAEKDASYAKWLLQVKKPDDFGTKTNIEITTKFDEMKKAVEEFGKYEDVKE